MTSLVDLYNARRAEELGVPDPSTSAPTLTTDVRTETISVHCQRNPQPTSLADLYNQRYESERNPQVDHESRTSFAQPSSFRPPTQNKHAAIPSSAVSVDSDSDVSTRSLRGFLQTETDELEHEADESGASDDSDVAMISAARSQSRSVSVSVAPQGARVRYVPRTPVPRRGALNPSATPLPDDGHDDLDDAVTPEAEPPSASASSNTAPLPVRPHPSSSKLVVQSESSDTPHTAESDTSEPPRAPQHLERVALPRHTLADTEETSGTESALAHHHVPARVGIARLQDMEAGDDAVIVVVDDSSADEAYTRPTPKLPGQSARSASASSRFANANPVVVLPDAKQSMHLLDVEMGSSSDTSHALQPSSDHVLNGGLQPKSIVIDDSSSQATPATGSDSEAFRRYPKRARNVTDYNVRRAFERWERQHAQEALAQVSHPARQRGKTLPVVLASSEFLDRVRQGATSTSHTRPRPQSSFADFLLAKAQSAASAEPTFPAASTRSAHPDRALTVAKARQLPTRTLHPAAFWDLPVRADREGLAQLPLSTRRALGLGPAPPPTSPQIPPPAKRKILFGELLSLQEQWPKAAQRRMQLESCVGEGRLGRSPNAEGLDSVARHLRAGRSCKLPLPDALSVLSDMERREWLRFEEGQSDLERLAEEDRARERGLVMVDVNDCGCVKTQIDGAGRTRFAKVTCATGGTIRVYFDLQRSEAAISQEEESEQRMEIVRTASPAKLTSASRLAGKQAVPNSDSASEEMVLDVVDVDDDELPVEAQMYDSDDDDTPVEVEMLEDDDDDDASVREVTPVPVASTALNRGRIDDLFSVRTSRSPGLEQPNGSAAIPLPRPGQAAAAIPSSSSTQPAARAAISKSRSASDKSPRDLRSYFTLLPSPSKRARSPSPTGQRGALGSLSAVARGKQRAVEKSAAEDSLSTAEVSEWIPSQSPSQQVEVVLDAPTPASMREMIGTPRKKRAHSPETSFRKPKHTKAAKAAEPSSQQERLARAPGIKPKKRKATTAQQRRPPKATPSPSRGGWRGLSSWYTARDAFTPTPDTPNPRKRH
ncbi:uncharacterized protein PAN0_001c0412 [Moesziomyces antarcticus]|uniref:Uncharacterized protein n=1 Tax=Pseudozyma antarctica TaxID=84753 RepID=A0A5C3FGW8_PSEA2|nr:uncharacterized protein PAN0_001c0412 [Moesziomyces antarcticus]GAK62214.1 hypothetical protein PAN0_001c0412 [Moesziomyces antarcticus]SPO42751.1 uncharacterized protein PSANT_00434 [Moesziomyces antarcticus]